MGGLMDDEYRYRLRADGTGPCPTHPGCYIRTCEHFHCRGYYTCQPTRSTRKFCTPTCRVANTDACTELNNLRQATT